VHGSTASRAQEAGTVHGSLVTRAGVELKHLLVVSDYARSLAFYRDVLGATIVREISDILCLLSLEGGEIMLLTPA
jgi:Glyoxalase/Bleomycin resistance protein/Dioxygenase superfamily